MTGKWLIAAGLVFAGLAAGPADAGRTGAEYFPGEAGMPFSEAVRVGDMLYLAGQIGVTPGQTVLVPGGIKAEAAQTMDNIGAILKRRGLGFENIVKCTVMLREIKDWPAFNQVYAGYFKPGRLPARSAFAASGLAYDGAVEVECWAVYPPRGNRRGRN